MKPPSTPPRSGAHDYLQVLQRDPAAEFPTEVFFAARAVYLSGRRLDMKELGKELGMSRATLYRRVGNRDRLLGAVLLQLLKKVLEDALQQTENLTAVDRVREVARRFMDVISAQEPFQRFLEQEPEAALRIMTSKHGPVQSYLVAAMEDILARGGAQLVMDRHELAYIVVRIGESFMYADVIADAEPNLDFAAELIGRLLNSCLEVGPE